MNPLVTRELLRHLRSPRMFFQMFLLLTLASMISIVIYSQARTALLTQNSIMQDQWDGRTMFFPLVYLACALAVPIVIMSANTIVRERESNSLDLLLTTPLRPHNILWGKCAAIIISMMIVLTAFLPILSLCFVVGGLGPEEVVQCVLVIAGFYALATMMGLAVSMLSRNSGTAARMSVFTLILFLLGPISIRFVYEIYTRGYSSLSNLTYEVLLNPIVSIMWIQNPEGNPYSRALGQPATVRSAQAFWLETLSQPGYYTGTITLCLAVIAFIVLAGFFQKNMGRLASFTRLRDLFRKEEAGGVNTALNTPALYEFEFGNRAVLQKEMLIKNRKWFNNDWIQIITCSLVMFLSAGLMFSGVRGGRDVSHSLTYIVLGIFSVTLSSLYAPLLPSYAIWQERLIDAWALLRTSTLNSRDIILGKVLSSFRQSALPLITIFVSFYISINLFFYWASREPEAYYFFEILMLLAFFLVCMFFYTCLGVYFSSSLKPDNVAPYRKTFAMVMIHMFVPYLVARVLFFAVIIGYQALFRSSLGRLTRQINDIFELYILPISPISLIFEPNWGISTFFGVLLHAAILLTLSVILIHWSQQRIQQRF